MFSPAMPRTTSKLTQDADPAERAAAAYPVSDPAALVLCEALHRSSNNLQLIVSAFNGILREGRGEARIREALGVLQDRVALMAEVNRSLSGPFGPAAASPEALERLCRTLAAASDRHDAELDVEVSGGTETPETRRTVLLLTAELMTNALKHGRPGQRLQARLEIDGTGDVLRVRFISNTPADRIGARPRIAAALAESVGGRLTVFGDTDQFDVDVRLPRRGTGAHRDPADPDVRVLDRFGRVGASLEDTRAAALDEAQDLAEMRQADVIHKGR